MSEQEKEPRELADIKKDLRNVHMGMEQRANQDHLGEAMRILIAQLSALIDDLDNFKVTQDDES